MLRVGLCGGVAIEADGRRLPESLLAGRQGRLVLAYLVCERQRSVPREELAELVWGERLPPSWASSLSAVISKLRRLMAEAGLDGATAVASAFGSYRLLLPPDTWVDWEAVAEAVGRAERAVGDGDAATAVAAAGEAQEIARRGFLTDDCPWVDTQRERLRDLLVRATQAQAQAHLLAGERGRAVVAARDALGLDELREASYRLAMQALAAAGERGEALRVWERCRVMLAEELGADPAPETEAVYLAILGEAAPPSAASLPSGVVTFLLTDIVESSAMWERSPVGMNAALQRHDQLVAEVVEGHGGVLLKGRLEGDATVSVFRRASAGALAALALREALTSEPWPQGAVPEVRMALHTGEAVERDGDYFGPALNRAARLRSLAGGGQILVSQTVAEVVRDHLPDDTMLRSLGEHPLRGLSRAEHVFELAAGAVGNDTSGSAAALDRPGLPPMLAGRGPFVGRDTELDRLAVEWATAAAGTARAVLIAGEPGVGKTRLAAEWARRAHDQGALVLYGRCDEDLGAPYQPFAEALRALVPYVGAERLRSVRGVEDLARLVPELGETVPGLSAPTSADPDTERYVLFDAVVRLLATVSAETPVVLVLDDLHWAAKPTLLMLRHLLRFGEGPRVQIVGTYRSTDLSRAHPLSATLADLQRDGSAERLALSGLPESDVNAYIAAAGYDDEELGAALSTVTAGNPFFLIEVLRHVEESGGAWDASTLPQGVREAVDRRLSRLSEQANEALLVGAVIGSGFSLDLVERVVEGDLLDVIDEACRAGIVIEEAGGRFRFNHALVRQSLLAEVGSLKRTRLHRRVAEALEATTSADDDTYLADLARHWFECALAGGAAKAVDYCRRAGEQAMARLAYEEAADLYDRALQAADVDASAADVEERADLSIARCEALLAAGDVTTAATAVGQLQELTRGSPRLAAWAACFAAQLAVLTHPEQLDDIERAVAVAADQLASHDDPAGEAKAHTVRAACLARLGRIGDCENVLDRALTAARRAGHHRRVNAVLAGAPIAALWGPNPVPRAGGRCLDVIRLLRITTGSPAVEATSIRCQAVLEAFRGRPPAARRMLDTARRTLSELGLRHALLEVDLSAGIVELVADEAAAAERNLRHAYDGFRKMGVDVDAAQAAAFLARACVALGDDDEAEELCAASERLGGHDLQSSIAWRAVRAQLLARRGEHAPARELAEAAVALAERTDALIDHGDACLALANVLAAAGDAGCARATAERAAALYERKGAAALVAKARALTGTGAATAVTAAAARVSETGPPLTNVPVRVCQAIGACFARHEWDGLRALFRTPYELDDRRPLVGSSGRVLQADIARVLQSYAEVGMSAMTFDVLATRGTALALIRYAFTGLDNEDPILMVIETDDEEHIAREVLFDAEDLDAAYAELDRWYLAGEAAPFADVYRPVMASVDDTMRVAAVPALDGHGAVVTLVQRRHTDGDDVETCQHSVFVIDAGRVPRSEDFSAPSLGDALTRFEELRPGAVVPVNANTRNMDRVVDAYNRGAWDEMRGASSDRNTSEDRRRHTLGRPLVVGQRAFEGMRSASDHVGLTRLVQTPLAVRGDKLGLVRWVFRGDDDEPGAPHWDHLVLSGVDDAGRQTFSVLFDLDDLDAAYAELDARYLAGEAAPHADVWELVVEAFLAMNGHGFGHVSPDHVAVDHRLASFGPGDVERGMRALWDVVPDARYRLLGVDRLDDHGAVVRVLIEGTSTDGVRAEWRVRSVLAVGGDGLLSRTELFDDNDLDAALARFEAVRPARLAIENDATRAQRRKGELMATADWAAFGELHTETTVHDDQRVGARLTTRGRDAVVRNFQVLADIGVAGVETTVVAVRGSRLALVRARYVGRDARPQQFHTETLEVIEVDPDGRIAVDFAIWSEDIDAAYEELDARYLAGEAAAHADTWRAVAEACEALNRHEWDPDPADFNSVDHRPLSMASSDLVAGIRMLWQVVPDVEYRFVAVSALADHGAVVAVDVGGHGVEGLDAHWTTLALWHVRAGRVVGLEAFADEDLDAALARFEELRPPRLLDTLAARALEGTPLAFNARDRAALAELFRDDMVLEDRRKGLGHIIHGGVANVDHMATIWSLGDPHADVECIAQRGGRLALARVRTHGRRDDSVGVELLEVVEVDGSGVLTWIAWYDPDDLDAAFGVLDARYLAGEAAPNAATWRLVVNAWAALNRHELPTVPPDFLSIDHRDTWLAPGQLLTSIPTMWELVPDIRYRVTAVHELDDSGAVLTDSRTGTSTDGTEVEWSSVHVLVAHGGAITRIESYPEDQLEAALARFEELRRPQLLSNQASRADRLVAEAFNKRDSALLGRLVADEVVFDDRRRGLASTSVGRAAYVEMMGVTSSLGWQADYETLAVRGDRLSLSRVLALTEDEAPFEAELVTLHEVDAAGVGTRATWFDPDDLDTAYAELDARYLAGEGASNAATWRAILDGIAALNRHEVASLAALGFTSVDHRSLGFPEGRFTDDIAALIELVPDVQWRVTVVHRLDAHGAVFGAALAGTSVEGVEARWSVIAVVTVVNGLVTGIERFSDDQLAEALTRLEELRPRPALENLAASVVARMQNAFNARDREGMAALPAADYAFEDRRSGLGFMQEGPAAFVDATDVIWSLGESLVAYETLAVRGQRLVLSRVTVRGKDLIEVVLLEVVLLEVVEVDAVGALAAMVWFDTSDLDAAYQELDARYVAGEAAPHGAVWRVIAGGVSALNRGDFSAGAPDFEAVDHRAVSFGPGEFVRFVKTRFEMVPNARYRWAAVHALDAHGAVARAAYEGTTAEGFEATWSLTTVCVVRGGLYTRVEVYADEALDAALARFEELRPAHEARASAAAQPPGQMTAVPYNAAADAWHRAIDAALAGDWDAVAAGIAPDADMDDRRAGLTVKYQGAEKVLADFKRVFTAVRAVDDTVIATRGDQLALVRRRYTGDREGFEFETNFLSMATCDARGRLLSWVVFDPEDLASALAELDERHAAEVPTE